MIDTLILRHYAARDKRLRGEAREKDGSALQRARESDAPWRGVTGCARYQVLLKRRERVAAVHVYAPS